MTNAPNPQPGWYPDPSAPTWSLRYWDGAQWTDRTTPRPPAAAEPTAPPGPAPSAPSSGVPGPEPYPYGAYPATGAQAGVPQWGNAAPDTTSVAPPSGQGPSGGMPVQGAPVPGVPAGYGASYDPFSRGAGGPAPTPPGWQYAPGTPGAPPAPVPAKRRRGLRTAGIVAAVVVLLLVVIGVVGAVVGKPGSKWFSGGVPSSWNSNLKLQGWDQGKVVATWAVPGATFAGEHPFCAVIDTGQAVPAGEPVPQYLQSRVAAETGNGQGQVVTLDNGAPGVLWTQPGALGQATVTNFSLYAVREKEVYWVLFATAPANYATEQPGVKKVMMAFKGTNS